MFDQRCIDLSRVRLVLVDGGYSGKPFATAVQILLGASVEVVKRNELHAFAVLSKRWVVERSFAWLQKMSPSLEELREKAQYQTANGCARLRGANLEKIVNRLYLPDMQFSADSNMMAAINLRTAHRSLVPRIHPMRV